MVGPVSMLLFSRDGSARDTRMCVGDRLENFDMVGRYVCILGEARYCELDMLGLRGLLMG